MNVTLDFSFLVPAAAVAVGVVEYMKSWWKTAPSWVWRAAIIPASFGVAVAADGGGYQVATNALALLVLTHAGYPVLVKAPAFFIDWFTKLKKP